MAQSFQRLDAAAIKALAHPLRTRLLAALRHDGPSTATALAHRLGENSGATSYHLRVLAQHGFVEEDTERGNGRDRWWRASHEGTSWRSADFLDDPEALVADEWLIGLHARKTSEAIDGWIARRATTERAWVGASDASDYVLHMTPAQLQALMDELHVVVRRHQEDGEAAAEPGAERAVLLLWSFPEAEPKL